MAKINQPSFSAGELSPSLWGRVDLAKYKVGLATCRNFYVDYRGGASTRAGTEFIGRAKTADNPVRLIPFQFSTIQTYVLELGNYYLRVIKDGAHVLEAGKVITGITAANPGVVTSAAHGFLNGDWVYFSDVGGMTELNGNTYVVAGQTANTFQLTDFDGVLIDTSYFTAYTSGGTAARYYTVTTPWVAGDLALLKFTQSADVMTLTHPSYPPQDLTRSGHASWTLTPVSFASTVAAPTGVVTTGTAGSTYIEYVVTAVDDDGQESLPSAGAKFASVNFTTTAGSCTVTWDSVPGATRYNLYRAPIANATDVPAGANHGYVGTAYGTQFVDGNIVADFTKTPPQHYNPFAIRPITAVTVTAGGSAYVASTTSATITDPTGTGASIVPIVVGGAVVAFIVLDGGSGYTAPVVVISGAGTLATATATVGASSGTYPATVSYFQQRKYFAAPTNFPETLYATKPGSYKNMDYSNPTVASDSLNLTLASLQVNNIKWMIPMPGGLVVLTGGGAWQINGGSKGDAVTPSSAVANPQSYSGCADLQPIVINYDILYVQAKGSIVRDLAYNFYVNVYTGTDLTILSNHLFNPHTLTEWTYAEEPFKIVWAVRDDGQLLSLTFLKEQEINGWARHDTQGQFKSITSIQEGENDAVYFVVKRYIQGKWVQYIERFANRVFASEATNESPSTVVENSWFVDCGLDYPLTYPDVALYLGAASGTGVSVTVSPAYFSGSDIGRVIRAGGGHMTITNYISPSQVLVTITDPVVQVIANDPSNTPLPVAAGDWSIATPVTTVSGLGHLEGKTVKILADGNVMADQVVTNGMVTLETACTRIIVGLGYQAQFETLDLEVEGGGSVQGKRKKLSELNIKVQNTRGIKFGPAFNQLTEVKQRGPTVPMGTAIPLTTGQFNVVMDPSWNEKGRICIQQDYPLPATILSVAPDVVVGDDG